MVLVRIPLRYRLLVYSLLVSVPVIAWEIALVSRAPIWDLPWRRMAYGSLAFSLVTIPLVVWLLALRRWAWYLTCALSTLWAVLSILLSLRMNYPNLTLFSVCVSLVLFCQLLFIFREMNQSFLNPQVRWYQGAPEYLPGLEARIQVQNQEFWMRVSRFDLKGVFLFPSSVNPEIKIESSSPGRVNSYGVELRFRETRIQSHARLVSFMPRAYGMGLEWVELQSDLIKDLGDLQERMRGEGYV